VRVPPAEFLELVDRGEERRLVLVEQQAIVEAEGALGAIAAAGAPWALLLLDVDGSRAIRDSAPRTRGELIISVADLLVHACDRAGYSLWYGNDEYVIAFDARDAQQVRRRAEELRARIARHAFQFAPSEGERRTLYVTVSGGLVHNGEAAGAADAIVLARERLAVAKNAGRNTIEMTATLDLEPLAARLTVWEDNALGELAARQGRDVDSLVREAFELLPLHYPELRPLYAAMGT
jgi:diguanylate cyclase (GGDEF)-like protein